MTLLRSEAIAVKLLIRLTITTLLIVFLAGVAVQADVISQQSNAQQQEPAQKPPVKQEPAEEKIPPAAPNALFPALVARVNGKAILGRDLEQRIREELLSIGSPEWKNLREDYRQELVSRQMTSLVGSELLYQHASALPIKATDAEVQAEFDQVMKGAGSDAALNMELASRGMERADLRKELEKTLVVQKFIRDNIDKKITVTPAEMSEYYSKNTEEFRHPDVIRTSHILISIPQKATPEQEAAARQRAEAILVRVRKGEDFAKLARENSMDASASGGGDIGFVEKGQLDPAYENAAWSMTIGQTSGLIRTSFGYHIIKVADKKKAGVASLEEAKEELTAFLIDRKRSAELDKLIKELRSKAQISILIPTGGNPGS